MLSGRTGGGYPVDVDAAAAEIGMRLVDYCSSADEHDAVRRIDVRLARELECTPFGWRPETVFMRPEWEAWLWGTNAHPDAGAIFVYGRRVIDKDGGRAMMWMLDRGWVTPRLRRTGLGSAAWPVWQERYGAFCVHHPSPAAEPFLRKRGWKAPREGMAVWHPPRRLEQLTDAVAVDRAR